MADWITLSPQHHRDRLFRVPQTMRHTAGFRLVPILLAELPRAVGQYVLVFAQGKPGPQLAAVLGSVEGTHLYLARDGSWQGSHIPAMLRGYPFKAVELPDGQLGLAIDAAALTDDPETGKPLFNPDGTLSDSAAGYASFLRHREAERVQTDRAVALLDSHGLLRPWTMRPTETTDLRGAREIDLEAFDALPAETVAELRGAPLAIAYAQIYARAQLEVLARRLAALDTVTRKDDALAAYFGQAEDDELVFKFDR